MKLNHRRVFVSLSCFVFISACTDDASTEDSSNIDRACMESCLAKGGANDVCSSYCAQSSGKGEGGKDENGEYDVLRSRLPTETLDVSGEQREYRIFVPDPLPEGPLSVLVAIHGGGGAEVAFPQEEEFVRIAQEQGVIVVFPLGALLPEDEGEWQLNTTVDNPRDIQFMSALLDRLAARYRVDAARVYGTGYSLGSMFTYELMCQLSDRFAAVASFAGTMPVAPANCSTSHPVAVMHIHGTADSTIPYRDRWDWKRWDEVGTMWDIPGLMTALSERFSCEDTSETAWGNDGSMRVVYSACEGDVRIEHIRLNEQDHEWPSRTNEQSTADVIWSFVSEFRRD